MIVADVELLSGPALDWAVAKCEYPEQPINTKLGFPYLGFGRFNPSSNWAHGGPIMAREIDSYDKSGDTFQAVKLDAEGNYSMFDHIGHDGFGPSPLVAAMRCYVAFKMGPEVEVPNELLDIPKSKSTMGVSP